MENSEGEETQIKSIESIKVCGITYSYNEFLPYIQASTATFSK